MTAGNPTKSEGEYELVLGNRQLLSAFFIIVILFGVFFTMGYVVGRNSAPSTVALLPPTVATSVKPEAVPPAATPPPVTAPTETAKEPAPVETKPTTPEKTAPPPEKTAATPPVKRPAAEKAAAKHAEKAVAKPVEKASATNATSAPVITPGPGRMYLQVLAVGQPQAGVVVDTLQGKGFPARLGQGPNGLFRVLVGPYGDTAALGKAKAELESAGFKPIVRK